MREFSGEAPTDPSARRETFQKLLMKECGAEYDEGIDAELGSTDRLRWLHAGIFVGNLFLYEGLVPDSVMHTYAKKLIAASEGREGQPLHALEIEATCRVLATIGKKVDEADAELGVYHGGAIWERLVLWKEQMEGGEGKWDLSDLR